MRTRYVLPALLLPALLLLCFAPAWADEAPASPTLQVPEKYVEEALQAADENRAELEQVLAHYAGPKDAQKLIAARFLIANMPEKGYILTELRNKDGEGIPYDPMTYTDLKAAHDALDAIEAEHGEVNFARDRKVEDVKTVTAAFLIQHIDLAFVAWEGTPTAMRISFDAFLNYVLPYRGSQEPLDNWRLPLMQRYAARARDLGTKMDREELYRWLSKDVHRRVRFDERFYLHPTDQSFTEMGRTGQGRCEDITNMTTYVARSLALPTAADYTPAWAHRDNNHAWNVLLDAEGHGFTKAYAHAAKVYRKTFAIQRDCLAYRLPEGHDAPNRFLKSTSYIDVTKQYGSTTDVSVALDTEAIGAEGFAYLCVFNGGRWVAIHWGAIKDGHVTFEAMGRNIAYLPAVFVGEKLVAAADSLIVEKDGSIVRLCGKAPGTSLLAVSVSPKKVSVDTKAVTPISYLKAGTTYLLQRWDGEWETVKKVEAGAEPLAFEDLPGDGLYWLIAEESRRLERIFTLSEGRQRFW